MDGSLPLMSTGTNTQYFNKLSRNFSLNPEGDFQSQKETITNLPAGNWRSLSSHLSHSVPPAFSAFHPKAFKGNPRISVVY